MSGTSVIDTSSLITTLLPDGTINPTTDPDLPAGDLLTLHGKMTLLRALDEKGVALQRSGRIGFYVPSAGQEACSIGVGYCIREGDWIFPSYRDHGIALMRGCSLATLVAQIFRNSADATRGRQMPNHWCDRTIRLVSVSSPVATQLPHAVGTAYASKLRGELVASVATFGDGGTSTGEFHAAMNFAGVFRTPTVFLCENNQYAISVPLSRQTASATIAAKGAAYGVPAVRVDGNDILAICKVAREALARARSGQGPTLIEAVTYRIGPHSTSDDPSVYRAEEEVEAWRKKDPIRRFTAFLKKRGILDDAAEEASREEAKETVRRAVEEAESAPPLPVESLFEDVYEEMPWHLAEQRDALLGGKG